MDNKITPTLFLICAFFMCLNINKAKSKLSGESLIGGFLTKQGEIKYIAALFHNGNFLCTGGIIGKRHVLTAAHCVMKKNKTQGFDYGKFTINAARNDLNTYEPNGIEVPVEKVFLPKIYNKTKTEGDIAVLKLAESLDLDYNWNLQELRLPLINNRNPHDTTPYVNLVARIAGYGWDKMVVENRNGKTIYTGNASMKLRKANAMIVDSMTCRRSYDTYHVTNLCAKVINYNDGTPQGICRGDSGGPLVIANVVIGVASKSTIYCNSNKFPDMYTQVTSYIEFINNAKNDVIDRDMVSYEGDKNGIFLP